MEYFSLSDSFKNELSTSGIDLDSKSNAKKSSNCDPTNDDNDDNTNDDNDDDNDTDDDNGDSGSGSSSGSPKNININHVKFKCQKGNNPHCINDIYTYDDFGLPVAHNASSLDTINLLYSEDEDYVPDPTNLKISQEECDEEGLCADGISCASSTGCDIFPKSSGLTGSPIPRWNNNALGGSGKRMKIDETSGNSYMDYIFPEEHFSNVSMNNNICNITKYAIIICVVLIICLITGVYIKRR